MSGTHEHGSQNRTHRRGIASYYEDDISLIAISSNIIHGITPPAATTTYTHLTYIIDFCDLMLLPALVLQKTLLTLRSLSNLERNEQVRQASTGRLSAGFLSSELSPLSPWQSCRSRKQLEAHGQSTEN